MRTRLIFLVFVLMFAASHSQKYKSQGDKYFYSYDYKKAINAYQNDINQGVALSNFQQLNLADAFYKIGRYNQAADIYVDIHKKDSVMSDYRFNKMLQSLAKTSKKERVSEILNDKTPLLKNELVENATFNYELFQQNKNRKIQNYNLFNVSSNSPQSDTSPAFYKENKLLFSSGRPQGEKDVYIPSGEAYLDIYMAQIGRDGNVIEPNVFKGMPNSKYHKSTPFTTDNNSKIYYILSNTEEGELVYDEKGKNALAIGMVYNNGFFTFLLRDLSTSFYYPFFDEKTDRLYFAANFEDGYGGTDLYYVSTNNGQIMSQPVNLGPRVNSPGNEIAPYILGNTMYFSSDVFYGLGGMDVYKTKIREDKSFSIPVNLGSGINSPSDEFGLIIKEKDANSYTGYLASNRAGGKGGDDIYRFEISETLGPKTISLNGTVVEPKYQQGIADAEVKILDNNGELIKSLVTPDDGNYLIEIPSRDNLVLEISKAGHSSFRKAFTGEALKNLQRTSLITEMMGIESTIRTRENKTVLNIKDFFFAKGKSDITPDIALELDKVIDIIQKFPRIQFSVETHTDSRGSNTSNMTISRKRADAIKNYLYNKGISSANLISASGYGEERIMNNCKNGVYCLDFLHKQNMRTLFVVQNYEQLK